MPVVMLYKHAAVAVTALMMFLSVPASAAPPGTQVINDASGDVLLASPLTADAMDMTGVWLDSGSSSTLTVTFELVDLRDDQGPIFYGLTILHQATTEVIVQCFLGDHGSDDVGTAVDATSAVLTGDDALVCRAGTQTISTISLVVASINVVSSNTVHVPYVFDATANTLTVEAPYSSFGGAAGDSLSAFEATTCDGASIAVCTPGDTASGSGAYILG